MGYIGDIKRKQTLLFPESLEEYIERENPVRIFDAFVDSLDMNECGFERAIPADEGRPGYDPRDMLKLYIYGYFNSIRSSRRLEKETHRNVEVMWLLNKLTPDFRTISDFRKDNKKALKEVFRSFNLLCDKLELYTKEYIAIDGSKFKAVNGKERNFTLGKLDDRLKLLDERITEYFLLLDKSDGEEKDERHFSREEITEKIQGLTERKQRYEGYQQELETGPQKQISLTDPESKLMKFPNGVFNVGYNVQTAVDAGSHFIADFQVTDHPSDQGLLEEVATGVKDVFSLKTIETVADKGYRDKADLISCLENGIIPNVFPAEGEDGFDLETEYEEREIGDEQRKSHEAEDIKACLRSGVIPEIYTGIITKAEVAEKKIYVKEDVSSHDEESLKSEVEQLAKAKEGYFVRDLARNLVYCPCGAQLRVKGIKKNGDMRYCNKLACARCKQRCTKSKYKEVDFRFKDVLVPCKVYGHDAKEKAAKNQKLVRLQKKIKIVRIRFNVDRKKLDNRKCLSEHPFGTVKRTLDSAYLLLKGKEKITGELSLTFMAYNIKRAISILGTEKLLASI